MNGSDRVESMKVCSDNVVKVCSDNVVTGTVRANVTAAPLEVKSKPPCYLGPVKQGMKDVIHLAN